MAVSHLHKAIWPVYVSLGLSLAAGLASFDNRFLEFMPNLTLLVIIYWSIYRPDVIGLGWAWMIGLAEDFFTVSLLGQHAMIYVLVVYFIKSNITRISKGSFFEFMPWLIAFVLFDIITSALMNWAIQQATPHWVLVYPVIGSILIWPWLYLLLSIFETLVSELRK